MTERPILFSGPMVRAILDGRKTQTRRVVRWPFKGQPNADELDNLGDGQSLYIRGKAVPCPYGVPDDRLWVRETHAGDNLCGWVYRADHPDADISAGELDDGEQSLRRWTPAIHMKREACRLRLVVTDMRVERLQALTLQDAEAEGVGHVMPKSAVEMYAELWDSLNAKRGFGWATNPWVWVMEFKRA